MIRQPPPNLTPPVQTPCWFADHVGVYGRADLPTLRVDERTASFNRAAAQSLGSATPIHLRCIHDVRRERNAWAVFANPPTATWVTPIFNSDGRLRLRRLAGERPSGMRCLHVHGGGWVFGGAGLQDAWLQALATRLRDVHSVEYRLAPEAPFPAALEDVTAALRWLASGGGDERSGESVIVCGESAGANLLLGAMIRLRTEPCFAAIRAAFLNYGTYDVRGNRRLRSTTSDSAMLNWPMVQWFAEHYGVSGRLDDPEVSPIHADLHGLPQTLLLVGSEDPVLDDSLEMESRLRSSGTHAVAAIVSGGLHGMIEVLGPVRRLARNLVLEGIARAEDGLRL